MQSCDMIEHPHREFFKAETQAEMLAKMDARKEALERLGGTNFKRQKLGRNATCPCGSGLKFKKCCIAKAA